MPRTVSAAASRVGEWLEWTGAGALALLVVVTVADVVGRYALNAPLPGSTELTEFGVAVVVFAAAPGVCWRGGHVVVDLADRFVPASLRRRRAALVAAAFCPSMWTAGWGVAALANRAARRGEVSEYLSIPLSGLYFFIAGICVVAGALSLLRAVEILSSSEWKGEGGAEGGSEAA